MENVGYFGKKDENAALYSFGELFLMVIVKNENNKREIPLLKKKRTKNSYSPSIEIKDEY